MLFPNYEQKPNCRTFTLMTVQMKKREIGNLILDGVPEIPRELGYRLSQYQNTREALLIDWLTDGSGMVIATRFGESSQLHLLSTPGGARNQLTFFEEPILSGKIRPEQEAQQVLFLKDLGGNELYQIFLLDIESRQTQMLTDGIGKTGSIVWNRKGTAFAYTSTRRNDTDNDIYIQQMDQLGEEQLVYESNGFWYPIQWSPDDTELLIGNYISVSENYLYLFNLETGKMQPLANSEEPFAYRDGCWDKEGKGIFLTTDLYGEFKQLVYWDRTSNQFNNLTADIDWGIEGFKLAPNGKQLIFSVNENGFSKLYLLDVETQKYKPIEMQDRGIVQGLRWHPSANQVAITYNTPQAPSDVWVLDLNENHLKQWTKSEIGGLEQSRFIAPEVIHYDTFDFIEEENRQIPAFYFRPADFKEPFPVLIYIHGGPESQYRPAFSPIFQFYLKELGVAIIAPNVRGSTGYGKQFQGLDNGYKREDSVHDIGKLLDWIEAQPELDASKVAVMGGSYGGYMVLASMTHYNARLSCGIDIVGISNFVTFLKNTKSYRRELRRVEYGDERDPEMRQHLERISPTSNAHKITKPMLIVQGLNDPRVPVTEAEQMLHAIRQNGGEVWYVLAKDEGHGFRKKRNRDYYTKAVILFLQNYLLKQGLN